MKSRTKVGAFMKSPFPWRGTLIGIAYGIPAAGLALMFSIRSFAICGTSGTDWFPIYFPYAALSLPLIEKLPWASLLFPSLLFLQYPVYGALVYSPAKRNLRWRNAACILVCHVVVHGAFLLARGSA